MLRTTLFILAALALGCSKPAPVAAPPVAEPAPAAPTAPATPPPAPVDPALLLSDAELGTYLEHLVPLAKELAALDATFAARYHGTAVTWSNLVTPTTIEARDALAVRHGYPSWAAFSATHDKVIGAMGLVVARALRAVNVAANMNRLQEMQKQANAYESQPVERERNNTMMTELKKRNDELRDRPLGSPKVPEANVEVLGRRQADVTEAFKTLRAELKPAPVAAPSPAPAAKP